MTEQPFWRRKALTEMTDAEWESLCDGCGKCCLVKLQDEDTGTILHTDVGCYLLDAHGCRCRRYKDRQTLVPDCVKVTPDNIGDLAFMPTTCAYRLLAEGQELQWWHHLVSGRRDTIHKAGMSVRHRVISEEEVEEEDLPNHIVDWSR
ncbi:MAG: YcgN family cysteine cluster protein [Aliidongia sp.]